MFHKRSEIVVQYIRNLKCIEIQNVGVKIKHYILRLVNILEHQYVKKKIQNLFQILTTVKSQHFGSQFYTLNSHDRNSLAKRQKFWKNQSINYK